MKRTPPHGVQGDASNATQDFDNDDDFKDVYPEPLPGESSTEFLLRHAFACVGYETKRIEIVPTHPVLVILAIRKDARKITDFRLFVEHIRDVLRQAGFLVKIDELTVDQNGNRFLVAFQWRKSPVDYAAGLRQAEQDAAEFAEMPL